MRARRSGMSTYNFLLPDIGEGLHTAEIVSWLVKIGDVVKEHEVIVEVQTDKAIVEISAPVSGKIERLGGEVGDVVKVGETLILFDEVANRLEQNVVNEVKDTMTPTSINVANYEQKANNKPAPRILAAPSVRKAARDAGVDLANVKPTGKSGKILAADLKQYIEMYQRQADILSEKKDEIPEKVYSAGVRTERIVGVQRMMFNKMVESKNKTVQCTGMDEINVTELVQLKEKLMPYVDQKLTYLPFIVKAISHVLQRQPIFNSSVDEEKMEIRYHESIHIGIAAATEDGLLVPVIRNADQKSILEIAKEIDELMTKARNKMLLPTELSGSTFTISSTGGKGGWFATPIINYPEVAILGIHKIKKQPIVIDDKIEIGHMMGVSLSFDHRIIDGEHVTKFMIDVKELLENPGLLILDGK